MFDLSSEDEVEKLVSLVVSSLGNVLPQLAVVDERRTVGEKLLAVWTSLASWPTQSSQANLRAEVAMEQRLMLQLKMDIEQGTERQAADGQQQKATEALMLGLVLVRLFAPPSVDPVQEMQLVRNCLHYQV